MSIYMWALVARQKTVYSYTTTNSLDTRPNELFVRYLETLRSLLLASATFTDTDMKW